MEPSSTARKPRTTVVFAIVAIGLLVAGLGIGYLLGRPAPVTAPGAVSGLTRPSTIPHVDGWYRNASVSYLDYGPQSNVAVPILAFFQAASPSTPVAGQRNIIDTIPGQPGYNDFWRVYKVLAPNGYVANSIRSLADAVASGYAIEATNIVVNCPVVNPNATIAGSSATPVAGWYRDPAVYYLDPGAPSPTAGSCVPRSPTLTLFPSVWNPALRQTHRICLLP